MKIGKEEKSFFIFNKQIYKLLKNLEKTYFNENYSKKKRAGPFCKSCYTTFLIRKLNFIKKSRKFKKVLRLMEIFFIIESQIL